MAVAGAEQGVGPRTGFGGLPTLYHGTNVALGPGEHIEPGHRTNYPGAYDGMEEEALSRVHATPSVRRAWQHADNAVHENKGRHHVYEVAPTGHVTMGDETFPEDFASDEQMHRHGDRMSEYPLRVVRELPYRGEPLPFTHKLAMGQGGPDYEGLSFQHRQLGLGMGELAAHHPEHGQVGRLQYQDQNWDPGSHLSVEMLIVPSEHKRRGVASQLMGELERRHPGALIQHGTRTMSGADWAASYYGPGANRWGGHGVYGKPTRDRTVLTAALDHDNYYRFGYGHGLIGDPGNKPIFDKRQERGGELDEEDQAYLKGHAAGTTESQRREQERAEHGQHRCPECRGSGEGPWKQSCSSCHGSGAISAEQAHTTDVLYHVTDRPNFSPDLKHVPEDNALAISSRERPGLFAASGQGVSTWTQGHGYVRPYVAELHVPRLAHEPGRWGGERFIPAEHLDKVRVNRVIPLSAHQDEQWEGKPYTGPDARVMSQAEHHEHKEHALGELRERGSEPEDIEHLRQHWAAHTAAGRMADAGE